MEAFELDPAALGDRESDMTTEELKAYVLELEEHYTEMFMALVERIQKLEVQTNAR